MDGSHLLIREDISAVGKEVACHDGAAITNPALIQLSQLESRGRQRLKGTLHLGARQKRLHSKAQQGEVKVSKKP